MMINNPNMVVITGGPGAGKTTTLQELERRGFRYATEIARQIIQEQVEQGGSALPWDDTARYTELMLERSIESFLDHASSNDLVFADRGIPDTLCYARLISLPDTAKIESACEQYRYWRQVFIAPPWREIYETDSERKQDFAEAELTYLKMSAVYSECGYELIELPLTGATERAEFMLDRLALHPSYKREH